MSGPVIRLGSRPSTLAFTDAEVFSAACSAASGRLTSAELKGWCCPLYAYAARVRLIYIAKHVEAGRMSPADGALEMLREELSVRGLGTVSPPPASAAKTSSEADWEPHDPIVHPYDPNPPVILPMDLDDTPEDRAAAKRAREARNAG